MPGRLMALHLHVPLRLRLDLEALASMAEGEAGPELELAVAAAAGRALEQARVAALEQRRGRPHRLHPPDLSWGGNGLGQAGQALRAEVEGAIRAGLGQALAQAGLPPAADPARSVLPASPAEPFDPARLTRSGYAVDSYQQGGDRRPRRRAYWLEDAAGASGLLAPDEQFGWWSGTDPRALAEAFSLAVVAWRAAGGTPDAGWVGGLYRQEGMFWVVFARLDGDRLSAGSRFVLGRVDQYKPDPAARTIAGAGSAGLSLYGVYGLRRLAGVTGRAALMEAVVQRWTPRLGAAAAHPAMQAQLARIAAEWAARVLHPQGSFALFQPPGGVEMPATAPAEFPAGIDMPVLPLASIVPKPQDKPKAGDGEGAEGGRPGGKPGGTARRFPVTQPDGSASQIELGPWNGEPSLDQLGALGAEMRLLMERIAWRLEMPMGDYPAAFSLAAAQVLGGRCTGISRLERAAGRLTSPGPPAAAGRLELEAGPSPALDLLRHLGATVPLLDRLHRLVADMALGGAFADRFAAPWRDGSRFALHFLGPFRNLLRRSIGWQFTVGAQLLFLQLARGSRQGLEERLAPAIFDNYARHVEMLVLRFLGKEAELRQWRQLLISHLARTGRSGKAMVREAYGDWAAARAALQRALDPLGAVLPALQADASEATLQGVRATVSLASVVDLPDGSSVIDDGEQRWTLEELDRTIAMMAGLGASIDPVVQHIGDVPAAVQLFRTDKPAAKAWLRQLLQDMLRHNTHISAEAEASAIYAFRASRIDRRYQGAQVPGTGVVLQGVHLLVHEAIGESFAGNGWYAEGIDFVFGMESGRANFIESMLFAGPLMLAVLCPPLGVGLGIVMAGVEYAGARARQEIPQGLLESDLVLSRAEAELELFMAELGAALAIIPEAGSIIGRAARASRTLIRQGAVRGSRIVVQQLRREILRAMARELKQGLPLAFAKALTGAEVMEQLLKPILEPLIREVSAAIEAEHGGAASAASAAIAGPRPVSAIEAAVDAEFADDPLPDQDVPDPDDPVPPDEEVVP